MKKPQNTVVILHNIRSTHNVGSIFRTADAAGASAVYLTGYTPAPIDRFGRAQKDIAKTALGAEKTLRWEQAKNPKDIFARLHAEEYDIVAVEQTTGAQDYRTFKPKTSVALVFGNEVRGLSPQLIAHCDRSIEIPLYGMKESLNVSVAAGIILFSLQG